MDGVETVPEFFYFLNSIEINAQHHKHLGSLLMNWGMKNIENIKGGAAKGDLKLKNAPMLFVRENSEEAILFYRFWEAKKNQAVEDCRRGGSCYMIIDNPKSRKAFEPEIIGQFEKISPSKPKGDGGKV